MIFRLLLIALVVACASPAARANQPIVTGVASVILPNKTVTLDASAIEQNLRRRVSGTHQVTGVETTDGIVLIRIASGTAMLAFMPVPIPNNELQRSCKLAWYYWAEACDKAVEHQAHVLVTLAVPGLDKIDSALLLTQVLASVAEATPATAVYYGVTLRSKDSFLKQTQGVSRSNLPISLWVAVILSKEPSGNPSISTQGLKEFGLMEIEARDIKMEVRELLGLIVGTARYLVMSGPVIKDGDTIGQSASQRIRVLHADSYWNSGQKVYRIDF